MPRPTCWITSFLLIATVAVADVYGDDAEKAHPAVGAIKAAINGFHDAASQADGDRYFGLLAEDAIFLGTDAAERFTRVEFKAYADPYFSKGIGWTYTPTEQHIYVDAEGRTAWFDERLKNKKYGDMRGTGVLRLESDQWKLVQYSLTFVVPNELVPAMSGMIRSASNSKPAALPKFPQVSAEAGKDPQRAATDVLVDFHRAAAESDRERFFGHLSSDAIVLGTDASEHFAVTELKEFLEPLFSQGVGWTSVPFEQHVTVAKNGTLAWFDERVISSKHGELRGTGVMKKVSGTWKIVHYIHAFPIPNDVAGDVVKMIRER